MLMRYFVTRAVLMPKADYRNQEIFLLHHPSDAMSGQTRKSFHIISEQENIDKIAISKLELKLRNFEKLLFYPTSPKI